MKEKLYIVPHDHPITAKDRIRLNGHKGLAVWFTGLSGSGKSSVAGRLEHLLLNKGIHTYLLDGDNVRSGMNKGLGFTAADRQENLRRVAEMAKLFVDAGLLVICAFISPLKKDREMIKSIIGNANFAEIFVDTPLEVCEKRDKKGLYKKAREGEIKNFTGISAPYEAPEAPDLLIKTEKESLEESVTRVKKYLLEERKIMQV